MKDINSRKLALTYSGCFLGAGFLSGQELWQFFGSFSKWGAVGLIVAVCLQCFLCVVILNYVKERNIDSFKNLISDEKTKIIGEIFTTVQVVFIYLIVTVMLAGVGALFEQVFDISGFVPSLIFAVIVTLVAFSGINGVVKIFSKTVPVLLVFTLIISVVSLAKFGFKGFYSEEVTGRTFVMPNSFIATMLFAVYNLFCSLGVLTPIGSRLKNEKTATVGILTGGMILIFVAVSVLLPQIANVEITETNLPMLTLSKQINAVIFYVYAVLLFLGMFGSAVSNAVVVLNYTTKKINNGKIGKIIFIILMVIAFLLSRFGFSKIIGFAYPVAGYVGFIAFIIILVRITVYKRKKDTN